MPKHMIKYFHLTKQKPPLIDYLEAKKSLDKEKGENELHLQVRKKSFSRHACRTGGIAHRAKMSDQASDILPEHFENISQNDMSQLTEDQAS